MHAFSRYPSISSLYLLALVITILCSPLTVRSWNPIVDVVGSAKDTVGSAMNETTSFAGNVINSTTNAYNYTKDAAEDVAKAANAANGSPAFLAGAGQGPLALVAAVLIGLSVLF
ncbi:hypothetical protein NC652_008627 [Populus alba x Populus x berolinensis]|nr:hypothetical protein NC652_008627 [Populus alba x Populus x berolinensis]